MLSNRTKKLLTVTTILSELNLGRDCYGTVKAYMNQCISKNRLLKDIIKDAAFDLTIKISDSRYGLLTNALRDVYEAS